MKVSHTGLVALTLLTGTFIGTAFAQDEIELTYWQYEFESKVDVVDALIEQFEAENPGITVEQQTFPYDAFQQQVAAAVPAGEGPDIVNLFYGWLPAWADAGYLVPLPEATFDPATIESDFIPTVQAARYEDAYWGLPTAVRNLALFYNQDMLEEAGITEPPATWDEFVSVARQLTVGENGRYEQIGYGVAPDAEILEFPAWETLPHERLSPSAEIVGKRIAALRRLAAWSAETTVFEASPAPAPSKRSKAPDAAAPPAGKPKPLIVVASVRSCRMAMAQVLFAGEGSSQIRPASLSSSAARAYPAAASFQTSLSASL